MAMIASLFRKMQNYMSVIFIIYVSSIFNKLETNN